MKDCWKKKFQSVSESSFCDGLTLLRNNTERDSKSLPTLGVGDDKDSILNFNLGPESLSWNGKKNYIIPDPEKRKNLGRESWAGLATIHDTNLSWEFQSYIIASWNVISERDNAHTLLGALDSVFLFSYAFGMYLMWVEKKIYYHLKMPF